VSFSVLRTSVVCWFRNKGIASPSSCASVIPVLGCNAIRSKIFWGGALDDEEEVGNGWTSALEKLCVCESSTLYFESMSGQACIALGWPPASIVRWRAMMESMIWLALNFKDSSWEIGNGAADRFPSDGSEDESLAIFLSYRPLERSNKQSLKSLWL
jgi:hypothetical protein